MTREEAIDAIVPKLVDFYRPERIYLFGSSARGDYRDDSDLDFMVLLPDGAPNELLDASPTFPGVPYSKEIVRWYVSKFDYWLPLRASFPSTIADEGRLLYERVAVAG